MEDIKLKLILQNEGITQAQIANKSGISDGSINKWVNGKRIPSPTMQSRIVKALNSLIGIEKYKNQDIF